MGAGGSHESSDDGQDADDAFFGGGTGKAPFAGSLPPITLYIMGPKTITCSVAPDCNVAYLKQRLEESESIPSTSQKLVFAGKRLKDRAILSDLSIRDQSTLHLVVMAQ
ncbi:ubiquitin [Kipferlia bialata]|uniref:Ubiquitin n=1 Tax=Kipferlia bialata TaxID=797122 RepID=A0A9K3D358_9EUKA|nr:ubiquitin [Kipferlia bialata]|eukprot:g10508.t1